MALQVKSVLLLFLLVATIRIRAQDLQCYVCDDCESGYESSLKTCQNISDVTEPPTEVPTAAPTTVTTEFPTVVPTVTPTATASTPTDITTTSDDTPTSTDNNSNATPTSTDSSSNNTPTSTDSGSTSTSTSIDSGSTSTPTSTDSGSTSTSTSIDSGSTSTPTSTDSGSTSTPTSTDSDSASTPTSTDTSGTTEIPRQMEVINLARHKRETTSNITRCVVASYQGYNQTVVKRGCSFGEIEDELRCRNLIGDNFNGTLKRCYICNANGCNSATNLIISFIPFAISIILLKTL